MLTRSLLALFLLHAVQAMAAPLDDGTAAYGSGDYARAHAVLRPLAQGGNGEAQYLLANMYASGLGVAADMDKAVRWYERAVANAHREAARTLGMLYLSGHGVPWDTEKGAHYIELADSFPTFDLPEPCE